MSYGALPYDIKIIYEDRSWQPVIPGYFVDDDESKTLAADIKEAMLKNKPDGYYFHHPEYGTVIAANLESVRIEAKALGGKLILN